MLDRLILNKYTVSAALGVILVAAIFGWYKHSLKTAAKEAEEVLKAKQVAAYVVDQTKALRASNQLLEDLQKKVENLENEKQSIIGQRDSALDSLRKRPTRAEIQISTNSGSTSSPQACTGSELSREDAEFLTREASTAALIAKERDFYYGQYEAARTRLETLQGELD